MTIATLSQRLMMLCLGTSMLFSYALLAAPSAQDSPLSDTRRLAIELAAGTDEGALTEVLNANGSQVRQVVNKPDGGQLVSVDRPAGAAQLTSLTTQLHSTTGVRTVEDDFCREFQPQDIAPNNVRKLITQDTETVEDLLNGNRPPWDPTGVSVSNDSGVRTYHSVPRGSTSTVRDVYTASGWNSTRTHEHGGSVPPPEIIPYQFACSATTLVKDKGPGIKTKLYDGTPYALFPYPRPVPLQAIARDFDILQFSCNGCGGGFSSLRQPIEDTIGKYAWTLNGKGSLNDPFVDTEDLDALRKKIKKLREDIRKKAVEIKEAEDRKKALDDSRDARGKALDDAIVALQEKKTAATTEKSEVEARISELESSITEKMQSIQEAREQLKQFEKDIEAKQQQIEELQDKIDGKPGAEEQRLAAKLKSLREQIKAKESQLQALRQQNVAEEQRLRQSYDQAQQNLQRARQSLAQARGRVQAVQDQISALENSLLSNPLLRDLFTQRAQITQLATQLKDNYLSGAALPVVPSKNAIDLANRVLQSPSVPQKQSLLQQFLAEKDRLVRDLRQRCTGLSGGDIGGCQRGVNDLAKELNSLSDSLQQGIENPLTGIDSQKWQALQDKRSELKTFTNSMNQADNDVLAAEQQADSAQKSYIDGLKRLDQQERSLLEDIRDLEGQAEQTAADLQAEQARNEMERERNTPQWLDDIAALRQEIDDLMGQINDKRRELVTLQEDRLDLEAQRDEQLARLQVLDETIQSLDAQIAEKQAQKSALSKESDDLQKKIDALKDKKKELEEELEKLEKRLAKITTGNKAATGQQVYYVPPPLEQVMKNKGRFQELKGKVAQAEADLETAIGNKEALQKRAFDILKGMNDQLWALKDALARGAALDEEITALDAEKRDKETAYKHKNLDKLKQEQEEKKKLEIEEQQAKEKTKEAKTEEETQKGDVEVAQAAVDSWKKDMDAASSEAFARQEEIKIQRRQRQRKADIVAQQKATHTQTLSKVRNQEAELGRIQDAVARASATGNTAGVANLGQASKVAQSKLKALRQQSIQEQLALEQAAADLKLAVVAEKKSVAAERAAQRKFIEASRELRRARADLRKQTAEADQATERRLAAEKKEREAGDLIKDQDKEIKDTNKTIDEGAEKDGDIKAKQDEIDAKKKEKESADNDKAKAENELNQLIEQREKWKTDKDKADKEIKTARDNLKAAKKALKVFLNDEFKNVSFDVKIALDITNGKPLDDWREKDDAVHHIITIHYPSKTKRVPRVKGPEDDLDPPAKIDVKSICNPSVSFDKDQKLQPDPKPKPIPARKEPQTIALYYRQGEPLYESWPPRKDSEAILSKSAAEWQTWAEDGDTITSQCTLGGGTAISVGAFPPALEESSTPSGPQCSNGPASTKNIQDVPHFAWASPPPFTSPGEASWFTNVPVVPKTECSIKPKLKVLYGDSGLQAGDDEKEKTIFNDIPGLLANISPKEVTDFDADNKVELRIQLFDGAHVGLGGEKIEWTVVSAAPDIPKDKYGLEAARAKTVTKTTEASGISHVPFYLDSRYGEAKISVRWLRAGQACKSTEIPVKRLLKLKLLKLGFAPKNGWDNAKKLFASGTIDDATALAKTDPDAKPESRVLIAAGLLDDQKDPVDGKKLDFTAEKPAGLGMDPAEMATEIYGFAWSFAQDPPDEAKLKLKAAVKPELKDYTKPPEVSGEQSTKTANQFRIGRKGAYLTIETEESFVPGGEPFSGAARLVIAGHSLGIPKEFKTLKLEASDIEVEPIDGGVPIATAGTVKWPATADKSLLEFSKAGFTMKLTRLGLSAGADGQISGKVKVPKSEDEAEWTAIIGPGGFLGEVSNFPEIKLGPMKLEKGAAVVIDMHATQSPDPVPADWGGPEKQGLLIRVAKIVLPDSLKGRRDTPPSISVKDLIVDSSGLTGEVKLEYELSAGLGKMQFAINSIALKLKQNEPTGTTLEGGVTFPDPFVGAVHGTLTIESGNKYGIELSTDKPVAAPSMGLVFDIQKLAAEYAKDVFSFTLSANLKSETFSEISIRGFKFNSNGEIEAEAIKIDKDFEFGKGFGAHLNTFGFKKTAKESSLSLDVGFQFGEILKAKTVAVTIAEGPVIKEFKLEINGERKPVKFETKLLYKAGLFEGSVDLDVEKLFGIKGIFVLGTKEPEGQDPWTFWYVELNSDVTIPLGQTGLNIIELGGGVGYNFDPPIGSSAGTPRKTNAFAFKASIAIGNVPRGEVFAGRTQLVLVTDKFSINGKVWLLQKEDSLYGEGQLNMYWQPAAKLDGFVRMVIALPTSAGKLVRFNGQVDFRFAGSNNWAVKSRTLEGAVLEKILAQGKIDIQPGKAHLDGNIRYDVYKEVGIKVVTLQVQVNLRADASLDFVVTSATVSLDAVGQFRGNWDVNLHTALKDFDIVSGSVKAGLHLCARNTALAAAGFLKVSWKTWIHSGSMDVDVGYQSASSPPGCTPIYNK